MKAAIAICSLVLFVVSKASEYEGLPAPKFQSNTCHTGLFVRPVKESDSDQETESHNSIDRLADSSHDDGTQACAL